jgi:uncharacterized protein YggU (UPF0235/DUF167 family)
VGPIVTAGDGITIAVRLTPKAKHASLDREPSDGPGGRALKASVTAPASEGAANAALIALLAKSWRLPKSALSIVAGAKDRNKRVHLAGDPAELKARIEDWMAHG